MATKWENNQRVMASQIIEIKLSITELSQIVWKFKNVLHLRYIYGFIVLNY